MGNDSGILEISGQTPDQINISLFLYCYGGIAAEVLPDHISAIQDIIVNRRKVRWNAIREDALISRSRCRAAGMFLDSGSDVMMQLDHDIGFQPQDIWRLCQHALDLNAVVGVPYSKRKPNSTHAGRHQGSLPSPGTDTLTDTLYLASGFMAHSRQALLQTIEICSRSEDVDPQLQVQWCNDVLIPRFPSVYQPAILNGEYLSEDYSFCARAHLAGIPVKAWSLPILSHYGMTPYSLSPNA